MAVLSVAGLAPTVALLGRRWLVLPLMPLAGSVIAALAATGYLATGGTFLGWFVVLAGAGTAIAVLFWVRRPEHRPWRRPGSYEDRGDRWLTVLGVVGAAAVVVACAWCLRGLATPTVGFDARALWVTRGGWFLQSHHQLLVKMRVPDVTLIQSVYPPLVSATTSLAWRVTGDQSERLAVVVIALLNSCAVVTASWALVQTGRVAALRLGSGADDRDAALLSGGRVPGPAHPTGAALAPMVIGVVSAVLLVFVAFGIAEPFITNGYADPIWSLAAVGAMAYGLQAGASRANLGVTVILILVAGMSKDEGLATGCLLIVLVALRGVVTMASEVRRRRWWRPLLIGVAELAAIGSWPLVVRIIHARGLASGHSPGRLVASRARASYEGMTPYLHVLVLAVPVAVVGGLVLSRVRRRSGVANDWWAWTTLAGGLIAVIGAFAIGTGAIKPWLEGTVHRVTEFPALAGWWIVATWAVVAGCSLASGTAGPRPAHRRGVGIERADAADRPVPVAAPLPSTVGE
jgi:hypothetical protein